MKTSQSQLLEEFNKLFCSIHPGDSGPGGNDPQEPVDEWACYPQDVRKWLSSTLDAVAKEAREEEKSKFEMSILLCTSQVIIADPDQQAIKLRDLLLDSLTNSKEGKE